MSYTISKLHNDSDNIRFLFHYAVRRTHKTVCEIRDCKKNTQTSRAEKKNEEIVSSNCLPHHKRASSFMKKHEATRLHLLTMSLRYRRMSESVQDDEQWLSFKEYPNFESREKNEEIISSNCLPHHKRASSFMNKQEAA